MSPKFDNDGLIPVVTTDHQTNEVLMQGFMNEEALKKTIETKKLTIGVDLEKSLTRRNKWFRTKSR